MILRILIGVALFIVVFASLVWVIRQLAMPPPPEPDPDDVKELDQMFRCSICGLRLTVTHAQDEDPKAPRHCREDMDFVDV